MNLYEILGIKKTASKKEVKMAFRAKAQTLHPDHGGDKDKFAEVSTAYKILIDDGKRTRYDDTGSVDVEQDINAMALGIIGQEAQNVIGMATSADFPFKDSIIARLEDRKKAINIGILEAQKIADRLDKMLIKLTKRPDNDVIGGVIENQRDQLLGSIAQSKRQLEIIGKALDFMVKYEYDYVKPQPIYNNPLGIYQQMAGLGISIRQGW